MINRPAFRRGSGRGLSSVGSNDHGADAVGERMAWGSGYSSRSGICAGGWQTVLIMAGVAIAVTLVIFVSERIYGVGALAWDSTGSIAHVTVTAPDRATHSCTGDRAFRRTR